MLIGIIGLGLIGGSFAKAYHKAGDTVAAREINPSTLQYALLDGVVNRELSQEQLRDCDLLLICTYPKAAIEFLESCGPYIGKKPIVMDCCGTKQGIVDKGMRLAQKYGFTYAGGHPMAGTQYSGFQYSSADLFQNAPMVIVPPCYDDIFLLDRMKKLLQPCGFSQITITTAEKHDQIIAYTSQLAHIVSSAYIKSPAAREHQGISAGSYRDMTRVAWLSPEMWTELCMDNRENLLRETELLIENLRAYRNALAAGNRASLQALFTEGKAIKEEVDG